MRYDKGHKDASRRRIMEVAAERFRSDGIAGSGLARIMSDAGLTNGAFYPHFKSKAELVRESLAAVMDDQAAEVQEVVAAGGIEAAIAAYLSPGHRDNPQAGCTLAALLPELAREPAETRGFWAGRLLAVMREFASALPPNSLAKNSAASRLFTCSRPITLASAATRSPLFSYSNWTTVSGLQNHVAGRKRICTVNQNAENVVLVIRAHACTARVTAPQRSWF